MKQGFTLLEVLISLAVISIMTGAALTLVWQFLDFSNLARSRLVAAYLLQEGIEETRSVRDNNWLYQRNVDPNRAWDNGLSPGIWQDGYVKIGADYSDFWRRIVINKPQPYILEVQAEVSWQERGRPHRLAAQEQLWNSWGMEEY